MDFALGFGLYLLGVISGSLVCLAILSDRPRYDLHTSPDNVEARARRVQ